MIFGILQSQLGIFQCNAVEGKHLQSLIRLLQLGKTKYIILFCLSIIILFLLSYLTIIIVGLSCHVWLVLTLVSILYSRELPLVNGWLKCFSVPMLSTLRFIMHMFIPQLQGIDNIFAKTKIMWISLFDNLTLTKDNDSHVRELHLNSFVRVSIGLM